jgi:hypothetical protein
MHRTWNKNDEVEYVVVKRDGLVEEEKAYSATPAPAPTPTIDQILSGSYGRRHLLSERGNQEDDSSDDEGHHAKASTTATPTYRGPPPVRVIC